MRPIKFRAYDMVKHDWIATGFYIIGETTVFGMLEQFQAERKENLIMAMNDIEITQYTGLDDMIGREIYEGDIIKVFNKKTGWTEGEVYFGFGKFKVNAMDLYELVGPKTYI